MPLGPNWLLLISTPDLDSMYHVYRVRLRFYFNTTGYSYQKRGVKKHSSPKVKYLNMNEMNIVSFNKYFPYIILCDFMQLMLRSNYPKNSRKSGIIAPSFKQVPSKAIRHQGYS